MKIAWATDIHLDCVDDVDAAVSFLNKSSLHSDALILSGDISVSPHLVQHLGIIEEYFKKPIYFVLGNHDYYYSDIISTRKRVVDACRNMQFTKYLGAIPFINLQPGVFLVGSDGWYDAYNGDPAGSDFLMSDWFKIRDFSPAITNVSGKKTLDKEYVVQVARAICFASARHIAQGIQEVASNATQIIVVTHVPPFVKSYTDEKYKGMPPQYVVPWYTSKILEELLFSAAKTYPHVRFTIVSGHTHGQYNGDVSQNIHVNVGKSQYGSPQIAGYIDI